MNEDRTSEDPTLLEIARLIKEFKDNFAKRTSDSEKFLTITELEGHWMELRNSTDVLYSDMVLQLMKTINERDMVSKKKENMHQKV